MTDTERLLHVLLHDLRTPIGVAQGYLRMMQEGRLTAAAEGERAVAKALTALGSTARLCQSAGDYLEATTGHSRMTDVAASSLVAQMELIATSQSLIATSGRIPAGLRVSIAGNVSQMSDALVLVLTTAGGNRKVIRVEADDLGLRFVAAADPDAPVPDVAPFDEWSQGLVVAVACRRIAWSAGQILKFVSGNGLIVRLPPINATPGRTAQ